ncbi:MAG: hypothetical protein ACYC10_16365 [Allorhizobium sp.]
MYPADQFGKRAVSLYLRVEHRAELRLVAGASGIEHQSFGDLASNRRVEIARDHRQRHCSGTKLWTAGNESFPALITMTGW